MDRERKCEGRQSQSPSRAGSSTTRTPLKLPEIRNAKLQIPNPKAFTLIELLVVIAVIALLMAILLPVLGRVRRQAKAVVCRSNLRQWGQIFAVYTQENDGYFPWGDTPVAVWLLRGAMPLEAEDPLVPTRQHHAYTEGIRCCPAAIGNPSGGILGIRLPAFDGLHWRTEIQLAGATSRTWEALWPPPPFRASYGFNGWVINGQFRATNPPTLSTRCLNVFALRGQGDVPVLLGCTRPDTSPRQSDHPPEIEAWPHVRQRMGYFCLNRHDGYVNSLFLDWSARRIGLKELWTLKWHQDYNTTGPWTKAGGVQPEDWPKWMREFKDY